MDGFLYDNGLRHETVKWIIAVWIFYNGKCLNSYLGYDCISGIFLICIFCSFVHAQVVMFLVPDF